MGNEIGKARCVWLSARTIGVLMLAKFDRFRTEDRSVLFSGVVVKLLFGVFAGSLMAAEDPFFDQPRSMGEVLGAEIGKGVEAYQDFNQYLQVRQAEYQRLDALKQQAVVCGKCPDSGRLKAKANQLEKQLTAADRNLCAAFDAQERFNPAVKAMKDMLGVTPICDKLEARSADADFRAKHDEFLRKVKAGDLAAYGMMGQHAMNATRGLPMEKRLNLACPYWDEGAKKGDRISISNLGALCGPWKRGGGNN